MSEGYEIEELLDGGSKSNEEDVGMFVRFRKE